LISIEIDKNLDVTGYLSNHNSCSGFPLMTAIGHYRL